MHTLLIDDDAIGVFLTERLLKRESFSDNITSFGSAEEALNFLRQAPAEELPRVIFLDLNMPVMDGWEFLEALRPQEAQLHGRCRIYILTSSLAQSDTARVDEFGLVAGLIHKPIDSAQIQSVRDQMGAVET
ncbi:response regulator [Hymenobacter ruricola]|uniref:Response regulator n=1 Tax=Hymenobacter ruricola TaxID=2791023 RepID=A0ABS0I7D8_9BACT|nr:response regulator [Hymenobacter ruricola]MBF9222878.1 response regulator [Hymenobacter ruricola]